MRKSNTLRIGGVPEHFNLPWHLAIESQVFEQEGIDLTYRDFPGGTGAMTRALVEDEIDIAMVLFEGAVQAALTDSRIKLVKVYVETPLTWGIHVAANSSLIDIEDAREKPYAISRFGSGSHLIAIVDAAERGWDTETLEFVNVGGLDGARRALPNGDADIFLWERYTTQPFVDRGEFRRLDERRVPWPAFVIAVREELVEQHRTMVRKVLELVDESSRDLMANSNAVQLISQRYGLDLEESRTWFEQVRWHQGFDRPDDYIRRVISYLQRIEAIDDRAIDIGKIWATLSPN